ncbi:MAG: sigma-70 family RNA polymerase sigma factor [Bacilli bacterium]|nr:sigma-70 family RNA polymerase sigma factor [Bacilli bacterium]
MDDNTVLEYRKLIYSIAKKYSYNESDLEDLYQVGNIGLYNALKNYKSDCGTKFSTYAHFYIKGEILKYVRENKLIKSSSENVKLLRSINKVKEYLTQAKARSPSIEEVAEYLEVPVDSIYSAINSSQTIKSLDYELSEDSNLYDYESYIEKGYNEDILDLKEEINKLNDEERRLIIDRYFLDKSQQETSDSLGISQVQVSRKESKILSKMRNNILTKAA